MGNIDRHRPRIARVARQDARMPVASLAAKLKVARGTVQNRMKRLEREGVIVGYTVRVKPQAEAHRIRALMTIVVEGNRGAECCTRCAAIPNVTGLHSTNGRWDLIAELRAESLEAFDRALGNIR